MAFTEGDEEVPLEMSAVIGGFDIAAIQKALDRVEAEGGERIPKDVTEDLLRRRQRTRFTRRTAHRCTWPPRRT